jgi:hypothetical protein
VAAFSLLDASAWLAGYDFSADSNKLTLKADAEDLDVTTFGSSGYKSRIGGLRSVEATLEGFWQSATSAAVDPESFPDLGNADRACTFSSSGSTETSVAWLAQLGKFSYEVFGQVGDAAPFNLGMMGTNSVGLVRGQVAKARGNVSATGVLGSALTLTAPTATQYVYCAVHIFSAPTTITLQLQSDTASNFPSATTVATIGPLTAVGGTWMTRVAGPLVGEVAWRLNVSAITGTANIAAAIAVQ